MSWQLRFTRAAAREVDRLPLQTARRVYQALDRYANQGHGDVRRLAGREGEFRLRVGDWRVRFEFDLAAGAIVVLHVLHRGEAYRR